MASENFYGGSVYSTDPNYKIDKPFFTPTGYNGNFSSLNLAVDARTANQLKEVQEVLNTGIKSIEVGPVDPNVFESIPKEHFKEINRLARLAGKGTEITFHAPMVDPTGITQQGWDRMTQDAAEKQLWSSIQKAHDLNPNGNVVATFHATSVPLPEAEFKIKEKNEETGKIEEKTVSLLYINESTGQIGQIKNEKKYFGGEEGKPVEFNVKKELEERNREQWTSTMSNLNFAAERGSQEVQNANLMLNNNPFANPEAKEDVEKMKNEFGEHYDELKEQYNEGTKRLEHGKLFLYEAFRNTKGLYNQIYKNTADSSPEKKKKLEEYAAKVAPYAKKFDDNKLDDPAEVKKFAEIVEEGVKMMTDIQPKIFTPLKEFAVNKAAETTANIALRGYNEFGKTAPIIAIENHPAFQSVLTTGEDLKQVVKKAQDNFVEKATKEGMSESEARSQAKKLIGVTWDVGHINMMRKHGYEDEDILKQTEAVAPFVKKVHLSDNFGFEHTELPMGMGNVPINKIMEKIGKDKAYDIKKVIEAGNWWQHFSGQSKAGSPLIPTLGGMGVPVYGGGGPSWNQVYGSTGNYFAGYGTMLPDMNFQTYGAGFSSLPTELGGQIAGKDSRFSGTPMA